MICRFVIRGAVCVPGENTGWTLFQLSRLGEVIIKDIIQSLRLGVNRSTRA